ncbi:MAG: porin [Bacteroidales bacterium]
MKVSRLVFLFSILISLSVSAQSSSEKLLKLLESKQIITSKEADSLLKVEKQEQIDLKKTSAVENVRVFGYGHVNYQYSDTASLNNTYGIKCLFVVVDAKITKNLGFMIQTNLGPTPMLYEFYGEWTPKNYFRVKAGQMKVPFSIENLMSRAAVENITGSQTVNNLVGGSTDALGSQCGGGRDVGLQFAGSLIKYNKRDLVDYQIGVFNGNGINNMDNNNSKDLVSWLMFHPTAKLKISTSLYFGEAKYKNKDLGETVASNHARNRWSVGAEMDSRYLFGRAEYISGKDASIQREGAYLMLIGHLPFNLDLMGEVDSFDKNTQTAANTYTNYQLGINWKFYKRSRLQLHYVKRDNNFGATENQILGQFQLAF